MHVETVLFGGLDHCVNASTGVSASDGFGKQPVFPSQGERSEGLALSSSLPVQNGKVSSGSADGSSEVTYSASLNNAFDASEDDP